MANPTNQVDYAAEDLATFLAKAVSDGTYNDVMETEKSDSPGNAATATQIATAAGQLWSNLVDDFFQSSYQWVREIATGTLSMPIILTDGSLSITDPDSTVIVGDGTGNPSVRIDGDPAGTANLEFFKNGSPVWVITNTSSGTLVINTDSGGDAIEIDDSTADVAVRQNLEIDGDLNHDGAAVGFYGLAPIAQPSVTGSRGGNAALASLLTELANLGLIADNTTL